MKHSVSSTESTEANTTTNRGFIKKVDAFLESRFWQYACLIFLVFMAVYKVNPLMVLVCSSLLGKVIYEDVRKSRKVVSQHEDK